MKTAFEYNRRLGLWLFAAYATLYAVFVLIAAVRVDLLDATIGGLNLAIWGGFGLIVLAVLLALIYVPMCRDESVTNREIDQ